MDIKLCDQAVSISINLGSNYIIPDLVDKCGLRKEVHPKSWLL